MVPENQTDKQSHDLVFIRILMKLFKTSSTCILDEFCEMFSLLRKSQLIVERKARFHRNLCNGNALCNFVVEYAAKDLLLYNIYVKAHVRFFYDYQLLIAF